MVGLTIDIQGGSIDAQATDGPGVRADKTQFNGFAIAITGGVVKAKGGGTGAFRWDIHAARIQIRGGNIKAADSPLHIPRNQEWKNANAKLYPVKLKVAPNADLSAY